MTTSPIATVEVIPLRTPKTVAAADSDLETIAETVVVRVADEHGRTGIGEADAPAMAVRELIEMDHAHSLSRGLASMLIGRDPFPIAALNEEMYAGSIYHGRRGLGIHALSAMDIALHDLAGKQLGRPSYELLGGARVPYGTPYATLYAGSVAGRSIEEMMRCLLSLCNQATALDYTAVKVEVLFEDLIDDRRLVRCVHEARAHLGPDITMMLDFGYRWTDWRDALWSLRRMEDADPYFAEAALQHDDLEGHARLAERTDIRVCGAEFAATRHECREWLERGRVDVIQPDVGRSGGLTEMHRIAQMAADHGALVIPHGWKTGITAAASRHFQAASTNVPYFEMCVPELSGATLRAELVTPEPQVVDGRLELPSRPGLGIDLVPETVERFRVKPEP